MLVQLHTHQWFVFVMTKWTYCYVYGSTMMRFRTERFIFCVIHWDKIFFWLFYKFFTWKVLTHNSQSPHTSKSNCLECTRSFFAPHCVNEWLVLIESKYCMTVHEHNGNGWDWKWTMIGLRLKANKAFSMASIRIQLSSKGIWLKVTEFLLEVNGPSFDLLEYKYLLW